MTDLALELFIRYSLSARRLCCLAFFALFGASLASLSKNASLNRSAMDSSGVSSQAVGAGAGGLLVAPETAQVLGSMPSIMKWSKALLANASLGTCNPRKPRGKGCGLTTIRGHSTANDSFESSSIFGWRRCIEKNITCCKKKKLYKF